VPRARPTTACDMTVGIRVEHIVPLDAARKVINHTFS
jgi:hypothetical protein